MTGRFGKAAEGGGVTRVEVTSPLWRVVAVAGLCGAVAALAFYLNAVHHGDDVATVAVITGCYTVSFWARTRPDRVQRRFGPFGRIARAITESQDEVRAWVYRQPLKAGAGIAVAYGIAVVIAKHLVLLAVAGLWSPWLAVAAGAAIGAIAAAPGLFSGAARRMTTGGYPPGGHMRRDDG